MVGDATIVASRVKDPTRAHNVDLLSTDSVVRALADRVTRRAQPPRPFNDKSEPIQTYAMEGRATQGV